MSLATRAAFVCSIVVSLAGCGALERFNEANRIDYKSDVSTRRSTLDVPPDLTAPRSSDRFTVPDRAAGGQAATLSEFQRAQAGTARASTGSEVLPQTRGARIERAGTQRWLVVEQPPEKLWPVVRDFWTENGFTLALEQPELGIVETDWAENRAKLPQDLLRRTIGRVVPGLYDTSERDRFRMRLEPRGDGSTEVYLSHRGLEEVAVSQLRDQFRWQPRANDPELEAEFLRRLLVKLGADPKQAQQVVADSAPQPERARLVGDTLQVEEGFDRAWRRVGLALDRAGFTVEDRDRAAGLFFVRYADVEANRATQKKPGLLDRMFNRGEDATAAKRYRIRVQPEGEGTRVAVLDPQGQALAAGDDRQIGSRILALLRDQLR